MSVKEAKDLAARQLIKWSASTFDLEENSQDTIGEEKMEILDRTEVGGDGERSQDERDTHSSQSATHVSKRGSGWYPSLSSSVKARMSVAQGQVLAVFKPLIVQTGYDVLRMVLTVPICLPLQTLLPWT